MYVSFVSDVGGQRLNSVLTLQPVSRVVPGCSGAGTGPVSVGTRSATRNMIAGTQQTRETAVCV